MSTLRILSIDGGGMKGLISAAFMKQFVSLWGIDPTQLWKHFDVIAGTSVGGIQALGYAFGLAPADLIDFFTTNGPWIFTTDPSNPSVVPSTLSKVNTIIGGPFSNPSFYPNDPDVNIGQTYLQETVNTAFGANTMQALKTQVIVPSFEKSEVDPEFEPFTNTPVYFSNSNIVPILEGQDNLITDVAMATSAAPLYFAPWVIGEGSYIDGCTTQNNPASFALSVGQALKPTANRFCVLSLGSGLGDVGFDPDTGLKMNLFKSKVLKEVKELKVDPDRFAAKWKLSRKKLQAIEELAASPMVLEGAYLMMYLLGAFITGPQEAVAQELNIQDNYTLNNVFNYRMQYYLEASYDTEIDTSDPTTLAYYQSSAVDYFNEDIDNISNFIAHLEA